MGLRLYKVFTTNKSRGPIIHPPVPSFSKTGYAKYNVECDFSKVLDIGTTITEITAIAYDTDNTLATDTVIASTAISSRVLTGNVVIQAGTVLGSPYRILVRVQTATEQSELEITMTVSSDGNVGLEMEGDLQMEGALEMEGAS